MSEHDELRTWPGAYVLGALDVGERERFEEHLVDCEACRAEVARLAPIPGLLARLGPEDVARPVVDVEDAAIGRVRREVARLRRSRARWRAVGIAAALALVVVGALSVWPDGAGEAPPSRSLAVGTTAVPGAWASATERAWGTEIEIGADALPASEVYRLVAISTSGHEDVAATWGPSTGHLYVTGATAVPMNELSRVVVTDAAGREIFDAA